MQETQITWVTVEPGSTYLGSDNRSIMFGGMGPRHQISIGYTFRISKLPLSQYDASLLSANQEIEVSSESEWQLAYSRGLISGEDGSSEFLADSTRDFWGKPCDGRPFVSGEGSPRIIRLWNSGRAKPHSVFTDINHPSQNVDGVRLVIRESPKWSDNPPTVPRKDDNSRLLLEEALICLLLGIIPSFVWAYFNASQGYIRDGWPNLIFGGIFFGVFTMIFWRPKQPTWHIESGWSTKK